MAKGEAKVNNQKLDQQNAKFTAANDEYFKNQNEYFKNQLAQNQADRTNLYSGYDALKTSPEMSGYSDLASTGGWDPATKAKLGGVEDALISGPNATDTARMRGGGVYDEFAKTGGFSNADKTNFRARGTSVIPSFYENLKNQLDTGNAAQGGFSPGYSASASKMARDEAFGANKAALDTEGTLQDQIRSNRLAGAGGMASTESALQDLLQRGKLGAGGLITGQVNSQNAGKEAGLGGMTGLDLASLGGKSDLYHVGVEQQNKYDDNIIKSLFGGNEAAMNAIKMRMDYNPNKSFLDNLQQILGIAGSTAGAAAGAATGLSGIGGPAKVASSATTGWGH